MADTQLTVQELFYDESKNKILDIPQKLTFLSSEDIMDGKYEKVLVHMEDANGQHRIWKLNPDSFQRIFKREFKGKVEWQVQPNEVVNVTYRSPKSEGGNAYFIAESETASPRPATKAYTASATPRPVATQSQYDGTHRQSAFRNHLATIYAGLTAAGQDVLDPEVQQKAADILLAVRENADALEKSYPTL